MHTILGAGGVIGRELSRALAADGESIRQVSRNPRAVTAGDETVACDLLDAEATAAAVLGRSRTAFGSTWHLPTSSEPLTGADFVRLACEAAGRPFGLQVAPRWMLRLMGLFVPVLRENDEMMYQFDCDYRFDSSRIEAAFDLKPTPYRDGIGITLKG